MPLYVFKWMLMKANYKKKFNVYSGGQKDAQRPYLHYIKHHMLHHVSVTYYHNDYNTYFLMWQEHGSKLISRHRKAKKVTSSPLMLQAYFIGTCNILLMEHHTDIQQERKAWSMAHRLTNSWKTKTKLKAISKGIQVCVKQSFSGSQRWCECLSAFFYCGIRLDFVTKSSYSGTTVIT